MIELYTPISRIQPKTALEVHTSRLGVGFEKLDRQAFDPEKAYDKVASIGAKWVRIQSGWQRTETVPGIYDFSWLDRVVDNLRARGMWPWICLCYGNPLYSEAAKEIFGSVGVVPMYTAEEQTAWKNYVVALTKHFQGRVHYYEIWNEPDNGHCWRRGVNGTEFGHFTAETAKHIRQGDPDAKIIGGAIMSLGHMDFIEEALQAGMAQAVNAISFHSYNARQTFESELKSNVERLKSLCQTYNPKLEIVQGEGGVQSRGDGCGALRGQAFNQRRQAKMLLRQQISFLKHHVVFSSYFSAMDMMEALNGRNGDVSSYKDYGYFGVIGAEFDEMGRSSGEYKPKESYYALQNLCSVFAEEWELTDRLPAVPSPTYSPRIAGEELPLSSMDYVGFRKPDGSSALAYWALTAPLTTEYDGSMSFVTEEKPENVGFADLLTGKLYRVPETNIQKTEDGKYRILNIPMADHPFLLTFGDFCTSGG